MYGFIDKPVTSLDRGGQFLIWSMRSWVQSMANRKCPAHVLAAPFCSRGMITGLPHFHRVMSILNCEGLDTYRFAPLQCNQVSEDEALILNLFCLIRNDEHETARDTLALMVTEGSLSSLLAEITALTVKLKEAELTPELPQPEYRNH